MPGRDDVAALRHEWAALQHRVASAEERLLELNHVASHAERRAFEIDHELEQFLDRRGGAPAPSARQVHHLERRVAGLERERSQLTELLRWLATRGSADPGPASEAGGRPLVSIVLPTHDRAGLVGDAVRSVLAQSSGDWELVVVDDGSTDDTLEVLAGFDDPRIRVLEKPHRGHAAARNVALAAARGEVIAYLDSDDRYHPDYVRALVAAYEDPAVECGVAAAMVVDEVTGRFDFHPNSFDRSCLEVVNAVPLPAFSHRRRLVDDVGGFDESLTRLVDWDLVLRCTDGREPAQIDAIAAECRIGPWSRVTTSEPHEPNMRKVRSRFQVGADSSLRVLYVSEHLPSVPESYVVAEINEARRRGIEVVGWSERRSAATFEPDFPIVRSDEAGIAETAARFRVDLIHSHHINLTAKYASEITRTGKPLTVRSHGVEFHPGQIEELFERPFVRGIYMFPHLAERLGPVAGRVVPTPVAFDPGRFGPVRDKDRRLVVRTSLGAPTKDLVRFLRVAARCPDHRFVLAAAFSHGYPDHLDELRAENERLGGAVEIRDTVPQDEAAELVREAGVYLHTHTLEQTYGMPISIAEAMATGAFVVARRCAASEGFVGDAGALYDTDDEVVDLLHASLEWDDATWRQVWMTAVERAHSMFRTDVALEELFTDWAKIAAGEL